MSRARNTGLVLMITAGVELLLFLYGMLRRSYLALALPMMAAMTMVSEIGRAHV